MVKNSIYEDFRKYRSACRRVSTSLLNEGQENMGDNQDEFGQETNESTDAVEYDSKDSIASNIMDTCKSEFGAKFDNIEKPVMYLTQNGGGIHVTGEIPSMGVGCKFDFYYNDPNNTGCKIWGSPINLTDDVLHDINKISAVYKNWLNELKGTEDIKPMNYREKDNYGEANN